MASGFEAHGTSSSRRLTEVEAALKTEWVALVIKKMELYKSNKALDAATTVISRKEGELNAARAALVAAETKASIDVVAA